ncbi:MAG: DNA polymerase ligase N-terminal domain-containing protein [bacterium]|nr:DNA polymerase ligase N-terminal domain-containing protein [bacterium]
MSLEEYKKKRKFDNTTEPEGKVAKNSGNRFVVHDHYASHHHYDFRLEIEGVLKSWAIPKGVPEEAGVKRLAVQVEDHPVDYIDFQGKIPEGQYGAGEVKIFDKGTYKLVKEEPDEVGFKLDGQILKGEYVLIRTRMGNKARNWLIIKR